MTTQQLIEKQWQAATIKDNFLFGKTMELYPDLCRRLLELILNVKFTAYWEELAFSNGFATIIYF